MPPVCGMTLMTLSTRLSTGPSEPGGKQCGPIVDASQCVFVVHWKQRPVATSQAGLSLGHSASAVQASQLRVVGWQTGVVYQQSSAVKQPTHSFVSVSQR